MTLLEVCVESVPGALEAARLGAHRVELCTRLDLEGLSPLLADVERAVGELAIPVHAMVRPREGDFVATPPELTAMEDQVRAFVRAGAQGVVLGCLDERGDVDRDAVRRLVAAAEGCPVTFHRAFDATRDPDRALEELVELGVARVLTSGGADSAWEGRERLRELVQRAAGRIGILAGGGVRSHNARALVQETGVPEVHGSVPFDPAVLDR